VLTPEKLPILETEKAVRVLEEHRVPVAGLVVNRVLPKEPLGDFLESRRAQEGEYLARIDALFKGTPIIRVPLLPTDVQGIAGLREVARHLGNDP
jgi:arsenite-transporting ATPase